MPTGAELFASRISTRPGQAKPVAAEPVAAEPVVTKPVAAEPVAAEPVVTKPVVTKLVVKSLQEVRSEQIQKAVTEQQRQLRMQKTAQIGQARREASKVSRRRDLPGYGRGLDVKVKEQMEGVEESIGEAFETKEKEIKVAAKKAMRKLDVTGEVVVLPDGEPVNKEWFDELPQEEKAFLLEQGLDKYRQEYLIQLEPETYVNKKWYNTLTASEQKDLSELGLAKWQETFYEVVGPKKELIPKSVLRGLVTPEFGKWLAYQEFQTTDYSSLEDKRLLGQQIAKNLKDIYTSIRRDPEQFQPRLNWGGTVKGVMDDPEQVEAFGTFVMAEKSPDLLKARIMVEKYTPSELEGFLKDYRDVAKVAVGNYMLFAIQGFSGKGETYIQQTAWENVAGIAQNAVNKWLDKINPNYTAAKNTEYASKMAGLGPKQYGEWFDEMMAGHGQAKTLLGEYVDRDIYKTWTRMEKGIEVTGGEPIMISIAPMESFTKYGRIGAAMKTIADNLGVSAVQATGEFMSVFRGGPEPSNSAKEEIKKYPGLQEALGDYWFNARNELNVQEAAQRILNIVKENSKLPTPTIPELPAPVTTSEQVEPIPLVKSEKDWGVSREVSLTRKPTKYGNLGRGSLPSATPSIVKG